VTGYSVVEVRKVTEESSNSLWWCQEKDGVVHLENVNLRSQAFTTFLAEARRQVSYK